MTLPAFDVVIPLHPKDSLKLPYCIRGLQLYTEGIRRIFVISAEDPECDEATWIPESVFPFTVEYIQNRMHSINEREGWYLQQLFKFYIFRCIPDILDTVLTIDSDIIICRPISFLNSDGKAYMDYGDELFQVYFDHMQRILKNEMRIYDSRKSGITDHMILKRDILEDLLTTIERIHEAPAWRTLIDAVDLDYKNGSGMSEFEFYFNFALTRYPQEYRIRKLIRYQGESFADLNHPNVDIVSLHSWRSPIRDMERVG